MAADNKKAALEAAMKNIEKRFGAGAVMRLGQNSSLKVAAISTGSLTLDIANGIGGLPRGRIVEIYGPESSGKTTLALHCIAEAQKLGGDAAFIDAEHALDPEYAANLGVDIDSLIVAQPDFGEQALEIADTLVRSGAIDVLVVDSVAALVPKAELEATYDKQDGMYHITQKMMENTLISYLEYFQFDITKNPGYSETLGEIVVPTGSGFGGGMLAKLREKHVDGSTVTITVDYYAGDDVGFTAPEYAKTYTLTFFYGRYRYESAVEAA